MKRLAVVVLAGGQGTRMKSGLAKVRHRILGRPLVYYSLAAAARLRPERLVVVVGVQGEEVSAEVREMKPLLFCRNSSGSGPRLHFALQKEQRGTAHAVMTALPALRGFLGDVVVIYGDTPLIRPETLQDLISLHRRKKADLSLITAEFEEPFGYGRILRDGRGRLLRIVEEKDCSPEERKIREANPGFYCYRMEFLRRALPRVRNRNRQTEYYLTDLVELATGEGRGVAVLCRKGGEEEFFGVNTREELARAAGLLRRRINSAHALRGVSIESPETVVIEPAVEIGRDTWIEAGARLCGETRVGEGCRIEMNARITDSVVGRGCIVEAGARVEGSRLGRGVWIKQGSVIERSEIEEEAQVGPLAHLRPGSVIGRKARLGNFVETKKARIGAETKISHLTYVGDAEIGRNVNLGCGFITCNYDGEKKWTTVIEDDVFVGSDTQTVAPVRIGKGAHIGSGSTITCDVPPGALALTRAPQVMKEGWAKRRRAAGGRARKKKNRRAV